jgi:hypothetical protein
MIDRKLYCFWFGQEMSENRAKCYKTIVENSGVEVVLVTEDNLNSFIIPNDPIHDGFKYLSDTFKSDYLRPYFMHHYGGGYTDIKQNYYDWNKYFNILEKSNFDCIGYREKQPYHVHYKPAQKYFKSLIGCGSYIHKRGSFLSEQWLKNENLEMDKYYDELVKNPGTYHPRAIFGGILDNEVDFAGSKYPFTWSQLCGGVWHRTQFENPGRWSFDLPYINTEDYR